MHDSYKELIMCLLFIRGRLPDDARIGVGLVIHLAADLAIAFAAREMAGDGEADHLAIIAAVELVGLVQVAVDELRFVHAGIAAEGILAGEGEVPVLIFISGHERERRIVVALCLALQPAPSAVEAAHERPGAEEELGIEAARVTGVVVLVEVAVVEAAEDAGVGVDDEAVAHHGPLRSVGKVDEVDGALIGLRIKKQIVSRAGIERHVAMGVATVIGLEAVVEGRCGIRQLPRMLQQLGLMQVGIAHLPLACILPDARVADHRHARDPLRSLEGVAEGEVLVYLP